MKPTALACFEPKRSGTRHRLAWAEACFGERWMAHVWLPVVGAYDVQTRDEEFKLVSQAENWLRDRLWAQVGHVRRPVEEGYAGCTTAVCRLSAQMTRTNLSWVVQSILAMVDARRRRSGIGGECFTCRGRPRGGRCVVYIAPSLFRGSSWPQAAPQRFVRSDEDVKQTSGLVARVWRRCPFQCPCAGAAVESLLALRPPPLLAGARGRPIPPALSTFVPALPATIKLPPRSLSKPTRPTGGRSLLLFFFTRPLTPVSLLPPIVLLFVSATASLPRRLFSIYPLVRIFPKTTYRGHAIFPTFGCIQVTWPSPLPLRPLQINTPLLAIRPLSRLLARRQRCLHCVCL